MITIYFPKTWSVSEMLDWIKQRYDIEKFWLTLFGSEIDLEEIDFNQAA